MKKSEFSIHEFKKWLHSHADNVDFTEPKLKLELDKDPLIGARAELKATENRLFSLVETHANKDKVILEFIKSGGIIKENQGKRLLITVPAGDFSIPRFCVQIVKGKQ